MLARSFQSIHARAFVQLPLNITEDRLIGGIDLERTLATGARQYSTGLLAEADGGVLFIDDINLLDPVLSNHVAAALESGVARVEREGMSAISAAQFLLLGTYNPAEGEVSQLLRDRVGLLVETGYERAALERAEAVSRALKYQKDSSLFIKEYATQTIAIKNEIAEARRRLPEVRVTRKNMCDLAMAALELGVEGNRADLFALRAARASAALAAHAEISEEDIIAAIEHVLLPRATSIPAKPDNSQAQSQTSESDSRDESDSIGSEAARDSFENQSQASARGIDDLILEAIDARLPDDILNHPERNDSRNSFGKRSGKASSERGRYSHNGEKAGVNSRVAIDATLRVAAPFQASRRKDGLHKTAVKVNASDLRFKRFKRRSGMLFLFVVDASGSMAINRIAQVKGALTRLLQDAYLHRDRVAMISFRGEAAETLLPPTKSVVLARRVVDSIPAGGGTPIAAGLMRALEVARQERLKNDSQVLLLLFTDGRANMSLRRDTNAEPGARAPIVSEELKHIGAMLRLEGIAAVVIDTKSRFLSSGEGRALAELIGGKYVYLGRGDTATIYKAVTSLSKGARLST